MGILAAKTGGADFEKCPVGNHIARCYRVLQLGTITKDIKGKKKEMHEVRIDWELCYEKTVFNAEKGEEPFIVGKTYTLSLADNAFLRKDLENWRGQKFTEEELAGFDLVKLLGVPCLVNVAHVERNGRTYADVIGVAPLAKGSIAAEQYMPSTFLEFENFDWDVYDSLSDYFKTRIANSKEYGALKLAREAEQRANATKTHGSAAAPEQPAAAAIENPDDLPF
jgi:hypothetical protein